MATARILLTLAAGAAAIGAASLAQPAREGGKVFTVTLTGANECNASGTCNLGDPDGTGTITLTVNPGQKRICYDLTLAGIDTPTAAHIHRAPAGVSGPVVVPFPAPPLGTSSGCVDVDTNLAAEIISKPSGFYWNVHNATYPSGALRGQLSTK
jgi:CHRD domain